MVRGSAYFYLKVESKMVFCKYIHIEKITKILILLAFLGMGRVAFGVVDESTFLIQLNKCVLNQYEMNKEGDLKVLTHPPLNLVCSGTDSKTVCKVMEKSGNSSLLLKETEFSVNLNIGDTIEYKSLKGDYNFLYLNKRQKKAVYTSILMETQVFNKTVYCSGTYKDSQEIKKILKPEVPSKGKQAPIEIMPSRIGD